MEEQTFTNYLKWTGIAFLVVFPLLFLGGIHVGPLSIRLIVAYGLLGYVFLRGNSNYLPTRGIQMYFIYLAVYTFINLINLTAFSSAFIKDLVAVHFVCCITIYAFPRLFKSEAAIRSAYIVVAFGFLLDAAITIMQYYNIPAGWAIGMTIKPIEQEDLYAAQSVTGDATEFRKSIIAGIMGRAVGNGYFIASMLPVMTYHIWDRFNMKTLWTFAMFALAGICIFFIQQRMALVVALAYFFSIVMLKRTSATTRILIVFATIVFLAVFLNDIQNYDYSQIGRLGKYEDELRSSTLSTLETFLNDPRRILLGYNQVTSVEDKNIFLVIGHNTFTDALRLGGIFLLLIYIVLFFYLCKTLVEIVLISRKEEDFRTMGMAIGCLCYLLYSQTHSTGVQSGSIIFWIMYMLTLQSHRVRYESINAEEVTEDNNEGNNEIAIL